MRHRVQRSELGIRSPNFFEMLFDLGQVPCPLWAKVFSYFKINEMIETPGIYLRFHWTLKITDSEVQFSSVQSLSRVWLFATPWITARQDSLSITNSGSSLRFTSIESVMPSSHLILCRPLLLLPPIPPSISLSSESTLHMKWPKYWSFSFSISPSKEHLGLIQNKI